MRLKYVAILLSILVVCQIGAAWTIYSTAIWLHKQSKQSRISDVNKWEHFRLSASDFETWKIEDDEIEIEHILYDIVFIEESGNDVEIFAVADEKENKMKRTLNGLQNESSGWSEFTNLAQAFSLTFYETETAVQLPATYFESKTVYFSRYHERLCRGINRNPMQPPCS
jgi:hypothetical protein